MNKKGIQRFIAVTLMAALIVPVSALANVNNAPDADAIQSPVTQSPVTQSPVTQTSNAGGNQQNDGQEDVMPVFRDASVHDPSVIKVDDTYYVFGSHLAAAKTKDLMQWDLVAAGANVNNPLFENVVEELKETFAWAQSDTLWAADVIQLSDGRFYMYYNACKGDSPRSALGVAVADHIEGPYEDLGILLKSGMWGQPSEDGTIYDARKHPNVVDPDVFFDKNGKLWMMYGSYSGGIFILEMDSATGKPMPDQGYGKKLIGGNHSRIEGAYILYSPETDYYYMYLSFGGLDAVGGYNIRVARSQNPDGPYYDAEGNDMINVKADPSRPIFDDRSIEPFGVKLMGNFLFDRKIGDPGTGIGTGYVSPGHNSAYYDPETGKQFLIFHTRFPQRGEAHEIRVHQMFMNSDGWPVVAPYRYAGETIDKVYREDVVGDYKLVNHAKDISAAIKNSQFIRLNKNSEISGEVSGTWERTAHNKAKLTVDGIVYDGVFLRQWDPASASYVMTFTALSKQGVAIWGSKMADKSDDEIVADVQNDLSLGDTSNVTNNLALPTEGTRQCAITWGSSNADIVSENGTVKRPEPGTGNATITLTATIAKGDATATKAFTVVVKEQTIDGVVAHYAFENNLTDSSGNAGAGSVTGDRIDKPGGAITYASGVHGDAAAFDGASGIRLPNGLISSSTYSVSLWVNPDQLTEFTTTFFGARDTNNWVSLLPKGHGWVNNDTMVWSGTAWYDAGTGMKIKAGEWSHLAFTVNNGSITVYVNGVQKFSRTGFPNVFTTADGSFSLGVNWWDTPYKGLMDELRIYETALTADEIAGLATKTP
ncbi:LamG-like jellyroll fold domain-containing protein [Paenibacillus alkaliterrae]|uniref:LamG-like jellyroll fold domain-containing protein n=1 Tax=Paenibacillus alkaliterrae TaxID=320909 RepID=UPI002E231FDA